MTEPASPTPPQPPVAGAPEPTAGALLRAARERQGLHITALGAALKIAPRKLEAIERDRWNDLPDAAFARALAQAMCRALKIDPAPVLARMPSAGKLPLDQVGGGLNTPFRDRPGRGGEPASAAALRRPMLWAGGLMLLGAVGVATVPSSWWTGPPPQAAPAAEAPSAPPAASAAADGASAPAAAVAAPPVPSAMLVETVHSAPPAGGTSAEVAGALVLRAREPSWVEVADGNGQLLVSRILQPGESLGLDGVPPLRVKIGNAAATQLSYRGRAIEIAPNARDNVARLELP